MESVKKNRQCTEDEIDDDYIIIEHHHRFHLSNIQPRSEFWTWKILRGHLVPNQQNRYLRPIRSSSVCEQYHHQHWPLCIVHSLIRHGQENHTFFEFCP
jgi:hypothetical protein